MFEYLTNIYLETTDPRTPYMRLIATDVVFSILLHTVAYVLIIFILKNTLNIFEKMNLFNLFFFLLIVMTLGFIARLCRSKCIMETIMKKNKNYALSLEKTKDLMNNAYFTWYFLS